jgi:AraC family transcriptional regulator
MTLWRRRADFWGSGPRARATDDFSFHLLAANAPEDEVEPHGHEEAHFVLVLAGAYLSSAEGAPIASATPLVIYNPPGVEHQDRFIGGRGRFLAISGGHGLGEGAARCLRDPYAVRIARQAAADYDDASALTLDGCALQLTAIAAPRLGSEPGLRHSPPWLARAVEMIFTSDAPDLKVANVAKEVGVHPVHLARVFAAHLGCAPGQYLRGRRLERAARLLGKGTASLAQIAAAEGFADQSHLTRAFRKGLGVTPALWRRHAHVARVQDRKVETT